MGKKGGRTESVRAALSTACFAKAPAPCRAFIGHHKCSAPFKNLSDRGQQINLWLLEHAVPEADPAQCSFPSTPGLQLGVTQTSEGAEPGSSLAGISTTTSEKANGAAGGAGADSFHHIKDKASQFPAPGGPVSPAEPSAPTTNPRCPSPSEAQGSDSNAPRPPRRLQACKWLFTDRATWVGPSTALSHRQKAPKTTSTMSGRAAPSASP